MEQRAIWGQEEQERRASGMPPREFGDGMPGAIDRRQVLDNLVHGKDRFSPPWMIAFFPRFFKHFQGSRAGEKFELDKFQRDYIGDFYSRHRDGRRVYKVGLLGISRGCGKTPFSAGLELATLVGEERAPRVFGAAGSKDQARIALEFAQTWVETSDLAEWVNVRARGLTCPETRGRATILSSEGRLGHGRMPSAVVGDEIWAWETAAQRELWVAMRTALFKEPEGWMQAISTAGYDQASLLGEMWTAAINHPDLRLYNDGYLQILRDTDSGFLMHWWGVPPNVDVDLENTRELRKILRKVTPAPWVDREQLLRDLRAPDVDVLAWRRLHLNQWTAVKTAWFPAGAWEALRDEQAKIPKGATILVGVDAALAYDTTAVAWAWRDPESGRVVHRSRVWSVRRGAPAHEPVAGDSLDNEQLVEPFIRRLAQRFRVECVVYDPRYFDVEAKHLEKAGLTVAPMYPQSAPFNDAVSLFYRDVVNGRIVHNGDRVLAAHVKATAATRSETGWRLSKLKTSAPTDACDAAIMAHSQAAAADQRESVYERKELLVVGGVDDDYDDD